MATALAIVERAYRGAVEKQFFDSLYLAAQLHRQLGGLELLLRGPAVSYAARTGRVPPVRLGRRVVDTLSDPRRGIERLVSSGVAVWVEQEDLALLGSDGAGRLLDGVRPAAAGALAARWADFRMVFFL